MIDTIGTMIDSMYDRGAFQHLYLDIETAKCPPEDMEVEKAIVKPQGNFKDTKTGTAEEKKAAQVAEKQAEIEGKDGLLDMNPIACIGVEADGELWHFSWFRFSEEEAQKLYSAGITLAVSEDEREMLKQFRAWCDKMCDEDTMTLSWNGYGFDLPRLRFRYAMNNLALPEILHPESLNTHIDLMCKFGKYYTINNQLKRYVSQRAACNLLKIQSKTKEMEISGENFPQAIAEGEYYKGTLYNMFDVVDLSEIGTRMGY